MRRQQKEREAMEANRLESLNRSGRGSTAVNALAELMRFPFQDEEWKKKFLIGSLLFLANFILPFLPMIALGGYLLKVMRQAVKGETLVLPEWEDWGDLFVEGLKGAGLVLIYLLPGYAVLFGGYIFLFIGQFMAIPLTAAAGSSGDPDAIATSIVTTLGITLGTTFLQLILMSVGFLLIFAGLLPLPLALGNYLYEGEFNAGLNLRQIWALLKTNKMGFLAAWAIVMGLGYLTSLPTLIAYFTIVLICLLPVIISPAVFYIYLTGAVSFGQYYRETRRMWDAGNEAALTNPEAVG